MNNDDTFKNTKNNDNTSAGLTSELEVRVVAWVLGEAAPAEAAELARLAAENTALADFKRRIEVVHGLVGAAVRPVSDQALRLSDERRAKVLAVIGEDEVSSDESEEDGVRTIPRWVQAWNKWALPMAACITLCVLLGVVVGPELVFSKKPKRPDPSSTMLGPSGSAIAPMDVLVTENAPMVSFDLKAPQTLGSEVADAYVADGNRANAPAAVMQPSAPIPKPVARAERQRTITLGGANTYAGATLFNSGSPELDAVKQSKVITNSGSFQNERGKRQLYAVNKEMASADGFAGTAPSTPTAETASRGNAFGLVGDTSSASLAMNATPAQDKSEIDQFNATAGKARSAGSSGYVFNDEVPVLGDVPVEGRLFKQNEPAKDALKSDQAAGTRMPQSFAETDESYPVHEAKPREQGVVITAGTPQEFKANPDVITIGQIQPAAPKPSKKRQTVTITAGVPQEFEVRELTAAENQVLRSNAISPAADPFAAPANASAPVSDETKNLADKDRRQLLAKGRSQYLAGDLNGAQESFRVAESLAPDDKQASLFLERIAKEKSAVAQLNRTKTRAQMAQEVTNAWQRPSAYVEDAKSAEPWKPEIMGAARERDDDSGVTITAGTPQKFTIFELTDADKKEIERRTAKRKMERLSLGLDARLDDKSDSAKAELWAKQAGIDWDSMTAANEVIAEIKAAEKKAAEADRAASKPDAKATRMLIESFRVETVTSQQPVSTFSLHVSDASFRIAKAALARGEAPDPTAIRPEEFYNAFDYGDPSAVAGEPVACRIEQSAHPFLQQRNLVRIAMKVPATGRGAGQPLRLTVLLDTSGSMEREDRAAGVRAALTSLVSLLGADDRITLIGFARQPHLLADRVAGNQATGLIDLVAKTPFEGGTNLEEALKLAGNCARGQFIANAQNRIVVLTDGAANLGEDDPARLADMIAALRQQGIAFDACGVGADGLDDTILEALTRKGDGRYTVINAPEEADAGFAKKLAGAFRPAAENVKVQVRFNPSRVAHYRLIGFEQHRLKTEDFRNDRVDAAELAAEEAAVALYQVEVLPGGDGELGEVFVRFRDAATGSMVERSWTLAYVPQPPAFARSTPSMKLAGTAAFLAEKLRGGDLAAQIRLDEFAPVVNALRSDFAHDARVKDLVTMFAQTRRLMGE